MKLFTKEIDKKLFAQFPKGGELANQKVIAKIFNPYGRGVWYIINSDPNDPDYLWAIVNLFEVEVGSVSRKELESLRIKPFMLPLERDLSFSERNALEVYQGALKGERFANGGELKMGIKKEMKEHGMSHEEARKTASDHLKENPHYYSIAHKVGLADGGKIGDSNYLCQMAEEYAEREFGKPVKKGKCTMLTTKDGDSYKYKEVTVYFKDGTNHLFKEEDFEDFFDIDEYSDGGLTFNQKVKSVEKSLLKREVPKKYRNLYGKTYDKTEAHESAQKIIGAQVKKYKK